MNRHSLGALGSSTVKKSAFPNAVVEVPTAIPAFIGYTEIATRDGKPIAEPLLINSLVEYQQGFDGPPLFKYPVLSILKADLAATPPVPQ